MIEPNTMMVKSALFLTLCATCLAHDTRAAGPEQGEAWMAATGKDGVQRVNIRCGPDFFDPRHIVVRLNVPVALSISTTQNLSAHSFVIGRSGNSAIRADKPALTPTPKSVTFTPDTVGDFPLACQDDSGSADATLQKAKQGVLTVIP